MVIGPDFTRTLRPGEEGEVDGLLRAAFAGPQEAQLVHDLRASGDMVWEAVLPWQGQIAAYAAISRMRAPAGWFCLAPVAVRPEWQSRNLPAGSASANWHFGTRLVSTIAGLFLAPKAGLARVFASQTGPEGGAPTLVVLGKPSFYTRCGFSGPRAAGLETNYPLSHMLIARSGDDLPRVRLDYPPAFDMLDD